MIIKVIARGDHLNYCYPHNRHLTGTRPAPDRHPSVIISILTAGAQPAPDRRPTGALPAPYRRPTGVLTASVIDLERRRRDGAGDVTGLGISTAPYHRSTLNTSLSVDCRGDKLEDLVYSFNLFI